MATEAKLRSVGRAAGVRVSPEEYERIALDARHVVWELHRGRLREKPGMGVSHNRTVVRLGRQLLRQLGEDAFEVRINLGRVRRDDDNFYVPDVFVVPAATVAAIEDRPGVLEVYLDPLPLVVEVWSPSTGGYDVNTKLPDYQRRRDVEIWRIHPYERTLTAWRRQDDGSYVETLHTGGMVEPVALPGVTIDLDLLFDA